MRFRLLSLLSLMLAAIFLLGACGKKDSPKPADFATVKQNTVDALFGELLSTVEDFKAADALDDGTEGTRFAQLEFSTDAKETGTKVGMTFRSTAKKTKSGACYAEQFMHTTNGVEVSVTAVTRGNDTSIRLKTSDGTYADKYTDTIHVDWDDFDQKLDASLWNPKNNPNVFYGAEEFASSREELKTLAGKENSTDQFGDSFEALWEELKNTVKITEKTREKGTNSEERQFELCISSDDFASFAANSLEGSAFLQGLEGLSAQMNGNVMNVLGLAGMGVEIPFSGLQLDSLTSSAIMSFLKTKAPQLDITVNAIDDRFSSLHAVLSANDTNGRKNLLTADMTFQYSDAGASCTLNLVIVSGDNLQKESPLKITLNYAVKTEGDNRIYTVETVLNNGEETSVLGLQLRYAKDTGKFEMAFTPNDSSAIDSSAFKGKHVGSAGLFLTGALEQTDREFCLSVDSIELPTVRTTYTVGSGMAAETVIRTVHPKLKLTVGVTDTPVEDLFACDYSLTSATAEQVSTMEDRNIAYHRDFMLRCFVTQDPGDDFSTDDGVILLPKEKHKEKIEYYFNAFVNYYQQNGLDRTYLCFYDEEAALYYCLHYDAPKNMVYYNIDFPTVKLNMNVCYLAEVDESGKVTLLP